MVMKEGNKDWGHEVNEKDKLMGYVPVVLAASVPAGNLCLIAPIWFVGLCLFLLLDL